MKKALFLLLMFPMCVLGQNASDGKPCANTPTVTDFDKNVYKTIQLGEQCWMKENLRTTHYADGRAVPVAKFNTQTLRFDNSPKDAYYYHVNDKSSNDVVYGWLYNWSAVMKSSSSSDGGVRGVQGICPDGWHVPSREDWNQLVEYVASKHEYAVKALAADNVIWREAYDAFGRDYLPGTNTKTNNATGFNALPAGYFEQINGIRGFKDWARFWSATGEVDKYGDHKAYSLYITNIPIEKCHKDDVIYGYSVRCIRNLDEETIQRIESAQKAERERIAAEAKAEKERKESAHVKESMDKLVALSASKFDVKLFGAEVQIHVDYDNNPGFWTKHFVSSGDLRTQLGVKFKPFFAIDSYVINEINDNMVDITIEKFIKKGKSEFWRTTIKFAENGLIDLDSSFDFSSAKQVVKE